MTDAVLFSSVNIAVGFVLSWLLAHFLLPLLFKTSRNFKRSATVSIIFTVAAFVRNIAVYWAWVNL